MNKNKNRRRLFLEFLVVDAEKGTYDKGYMGKGGKKSILAREDSVMSTLVRKLRVTQKQIYLSPQGVGVGWGME